jgi:hypothetical protein
VDIGLALLGTVVWTVRSVRLGGALRRVRVVGPLDPKCCAVTRHGLRAYPSGTARLHLKRPRHRHDAQMPRLACVDSRIGG